MDNPLALNTTMQAMQVIELVLAGKSVTEACEEVGISRSTYYNWVNSGIFTNLIREQIAPAVQEMQITVLAALPDVVREMLRIATGDTKHDADVIKAAQMLFERILKPMMAEAPEPSTAEHDFLAQEPDWKRVKRVTVTVEHDDIIDVTPEVEEVA